MVLSSSLFSLTLFLGDPARPLSPPPAGIMSSLALYLFTYTYSYSAVIVTPFPLFQCRAYRINVGSPGAGMQSCCVRS